MIFILSARADMARKLALDMGLTPNQWVWLHNPEQLRGVEEAHILVVPGWGRYQKMEAADAMLRMIKERRCVRWVKA